MLERKSSTAQSSERLVARRRKMRRRSLVVFGVLFALLVGAFIWLSWQPYVRVTEVTLTNNDRALLTLINEQLAGTRLGIVPRNSFFFIPESDIRAAVIEMNPGIQAVSIKREGLTGLEVELHERVPVARWCGLQKTEGVLEYCYLFDAEGYVYAAADSATSTPTLNSFAVYDSPLNEALEPLRSTLLHARATPSAFDFARRITSLGSSVLTITFKDDEATLVLTSGTSLIYVLGSEEEAFADLMSAKANLSLTDSSVEYVDLRFPGKVYLKRRGDTVVE